MKKLLQLTKNALNSGIWGKVPVAIQWVEVRTPKLRLLAKPPKTEDKVNRLNTLILGCTAFVLLYTAIFATTQLVNQSRSEQEPEPPRFATVHTNDYARRL